MNGFLVGSNGWGLTFLFFGYASRGKLCYYTIFAETVHAVVFAVLVGGLCSWYSDMLPGGINPMIFG